MSTVVFVDGAYLDKLLELNFNMAKVDYAKFVDLLTVETSTDNESPSKVFYYHCPPYLPYEPTDFERSRYNNKMRFFGALKQLNGFTTRLGRLVFRGIKKDTDKPIFVQKKVTTQFALDFMDVVYNEDKVNRIVIVAGDSEYVPLIEAAAESDLDVTLCHGTSKDRNNNMVHKSLYDACSQQYEITNDLIQRCLR